MKLGTGITLQGGKYLLGKALGSAEFGITYLATQTHLNQAVVLKTLDPSLQVTRSFPQLHQRFVEEVRLLARSQHPSIVRVLDFFQEENLPFIVMEYVPGKTLAELIASQGPFAEAQAVHYIRQIGSALAVAHRMGLIHRNIQPQTIIRKQGTHLAVLVGFGLAHGLATTVTPPQTHISDVNEFAPPNDSWVANNRFAIDCYALAAILYYLLTGRPPIAPLELDSFSWSPAVKQAIFRGMAKEATLQPQTIADWLRLLPNEAVPLAAPPNGVVASLPKATPQNGSAPKGITQAPALPSVKPQAATQPPSAPLVPSSERGASLPVVPTISQTTPTETIAPAAILRSFPQTTATARPAINRHIPKILGLTTATTAAIGVGFGLALRFSAANTPGASIFHPEQSFPSKEWKGTLNPEGDLSDIPIEKPGASPGIYNDEPIAPPPEVTLPSIPKSKPVSPPPELYPELEPIQPISPPRSTSRVKPAPVDPVPVAKPDPIPAPIPSLVDPVPAVPAPVPIAPEPLSPVPEVAPANSSTNSSPRDISPAKEVTKP